MPRATVRRGGNGKFVVSESVGAALATAGVEILSVALFVFAARKA